MLLDTFTAKIARNGRLRLPDLFSAHHSVELRFELAGVPVGIRSYISQGAINGHPGISLPQQVVDLLQPPCEQVVAAYACNSIAPRAQQVVGIDQVVVFKARVSIAKKSKFVSIPAPWTRGFSAIGWDQMKWVVHYRGTTTQFNAPLHINVQGVGSFTIPAAQATALEEGVDVLVYARPIGFRRPMANAWFRSDWFDAALALPDDVVTEDDGDHLVITSPYAAPIRMRRRVPAGAWCYLLGLYQAEGNKAGLAFEIPQKTPELLRDVLRLLTDTLGLDRSRFSLDVVMRNDSPHTGAELRDLYEGTVGLPVRYVTDKRDHDLENKSYRPARGTYNAQITFREGVILQRIVKAALDRLIDVELKSLPPLCAQAFAHGFLDGDGTFIENDAAYLHVAGDERELRAALTAAEQGFRWKRQEAAVLDYRGPSDGIRRRLDLTEMAALLASGVFKYNLARARMLHVAFQRWQVSDFADTGSALEACREEFKEVCDVLPTLESTKQGKGHSYPLLGTAVEKDVDELRLSWLVEAGVKQAKATLKLAGKAHQRLIRERQARLRPEPMLASLDRCRVVALTTKDVEALIEEYEWLGTVGRPLACYGLLSPRKRIDVHNVQGEELLGAVCFSVGPGSNSHDVCGPENKEKAVCLSRGACVHWAPKNAASFLIRGAIKQAHLDHGWQIFFAYSDEQAGEIGTVYQASNWNYIGRSAGGNMEKFVSPDGSLTLSSRAMRARTGKTKKEAVLAGWTPIQEARKHKYVWFEGRWAPLLRKACRFPFLPYPKRA